jgi:hypothetical protein
MEQNINTFKNSRAGLVILLMSTFASLFVSVFWWLSQVTDLYHFVLVGAIYEILWFPSLLMLFFLPIISLIYWVKEKFNIRSFYLYSILIVVPTILFLVFTG